MARLEEGGGGNRRGVGLPIQLNRRGETAEDLQDFQAKPLSTPYCQRRNRRRGILRTLHLPAPYPFMRHPTLYTVIIFVHSAYSRVLFQANCTKLTRLGRSPSPGSFIDPRAAYASGG